MISMIYDSCQDAELQLRHLQDLLEAAEAMAKAAVGEVQIPVPLSRSASDYFFNDGLRWHGTDSVRQSSLSLRHRNTFQERLQHCDSSSLQ